MRVCTRRRTFIGAVHPSQGGTALIVALFMIIVVAALGAFAIRIAAIQQQTANLELLSYRALAAAHSGLEFGSNRISLTINICSPNPPTSLAVGDFTVTVSCPTPSNHVISGVNYRIYDLTAIAAYGTYGSSDFVQRTLTRHVTSAVW